MPDLASVTRRLQAVGQSHLLRFHAELSHAQQEALVRQIDGLPLEEVPTLIDRYVRRAEKFTLPEDLKPAPYYPADPRDPTRPWNRGQARSEGEALLRAGRIAAFTVAGGQGTRLGYEGPKGCYLAGAVTRKPLFQIFAEGILAATRRYGATVPWYIMTSPLNHAPTVAFFEAHAYFGLEPGNVMFFPQGVMPSFDRATGRILLAARYEVATNPDGHGGSLKALHASGAIADMKHRGVQHISYFQVDNPTVRVLDPVFLGLHASAPDSSAQMSSKMLPKAYPEEKLGVFCSAGGRTQVIEYSDLPMDIQRERARDGRLRFLAGSIAVHALGVEFVERLATDPSFALPYHRADKKVPHVDIETGDPVTPSEPNGVKLERFVFDALPLATGSIVYETDRVEEFAPIKNASGVDSPESSARLQTERAARWLETVGLRVPRNDQGEPDCTLEISPLTATCADELAGAHLPARIERGQELAI